MDVVDCSGESLDVRMGGVSLGRLGQRVEREVYSLKGPPVSGRFEKAMWNITPRPSGMDTAWTEPLTLPLGNATLSKAVPGRVAMYEAPIGLSVTAMAFPRAWEGDVR